jgi:Uncharacterized protein involved in exopolysaccharide biosynthesis
VFLSQYLRILWARKWLVLSLFIVVAAAGIAITLLMPRQYTADTSLVVEMRIDPRSGHWRRRSQHPATWPLRSRS